MSDPAGQVVIGRIGLSSAERAAVEALADLCRTHDGADLPLYLERDETAPPTAPTQLLSYHDGVLIGFAGIESCQLPEACGMVHPAYRRRSVGRALLTAARAACGAQGQEHFLLICDQAVAPGPSFALAMGGQYRFAEHRMRLDPTGIDCGTTHDDLLTLRPATLDDARVLAQLTAQAFDDPEESTLERILPWLRDPSQHLYLATLHGRPVGCLRVEQRGDHAAIYTFAVDPRRQRRGHGREILRRTVAMLLAEGRAPVTLEVVTENANALALYLSCGFREVATVGYYLFQV